MKHYNVTVTCITDNPSINSKVEVVEAKSDEDARAIAEYLFGKARIINISPKLRYAPSVGRYMSDWS